MESALHLHLNKICFSRVVAALFLALSLRGPDLSGALDDSREYRMATDDREYDIMWRWSFLKTSDNHRTVDVEPHTAAPQSSQTAGAGTFSAKHGCAGGTRAAGTRSGPRHVLPALPLFPAGGGTERDPQDRAVPGGQAQCHDEAERR